MRLCTILVLGTLVLPALSGVAAKPPTPASATPAASDESKLLPGEWITLDDQSGLRIAPGKVRVSFIVRVDDTPRAVRIWVARSATPDLSRAIWQEVPLQDGPPAPQDDKRIQKIADIPEGTPEKPYFAVRGEVEVAADGSVRRLASKTLAYPRVGAWTLKGEHGVRRALAQPSQEPRSLRLMVAHAATHDFRNAKWKSLPMKTDASAPWRNYEAAVPPAPPATPYTAIYAETTFGDGPRPVSIASPRVIWNGKPLPADARQRDTKVCPLHGTEEGVVPIIYGLVGRDALEDAVYAGCIVGPGSPAWHCRLCDCDWGDALKEEKPRP